MTVYNPRRLLFYALLKLTVCIRNCWLMFFYASAVRNSVSTLKPCYFESQIHEPFLTLLKLFESRRLYCYFILGTSTLMQNRSIFSLNYYYNCSFHTTGRTNARTFARANQSTKSVSFFVSKSISSRFHTRGIVPHKTTCPPRRFVRL